MKIRLHAKRRTAQTQANIKSDVSTFPGSATSKRNCTHDDSLGPNDYQTSALTHVRRIYIISHLSLQRCS